MTDCLLCDAAAADASFERVRVWQDELWRPGVNLRAPEISAEIHARSTAEIARRIAE